MYKSRARPLIPSFLELFLCHPRPHTLETHPSCHLTLSEFGTSSRLVVPAKAQKSFLIILFSSSPYIQSIIKATQFYLQNIS